MSEERLIELAKLFGWYNGSKAGFLFSERSLEAFAKKIREDALDEAISACDLTLERHGLHSNNICKHYIRELKEDVWE